MEPNEPDEPIEKQTGSCQPSPGEGVEILSQPVNFFSLIGPGDEAIMSNDPFSSSWKRINA